jgi:hypothetical protein
VNGIIYDDPGINSLWAYYSSTSVSEGIQYASTSASPVGQSWGNVWSDNRYSFTGGGGYGGWAFVGGSQSAYCGDPSSCSPSVKQPALLGFGQDVGSTGI